METGSSKENELLQMSNIAVSPVYGSLESFQIERKIGKGQFSVVYRAKCVSKQVTTRDKTIFKHFMIC